MNETLPCPGCHTPLTPEATGCHICMRARTKQEIVRGYAKLREDQARRKRRPFQILGAVLAIGAAAWLVVRFQAPLRDAARAAKNGAASRYDRFVDANTYAPQKAPETGPAVGESGGPKSPFAPVTTVPKELELQAPGSTIPVAATPTAPAEPVKPAVPKNSWVVTGTVYDLDNLKPAKKVTVTFTREKMPQVVVETDDTGAYEAVLAKGDGWTALVEGNHRRRGQVLDLDPPYRTRDVDERKAAWDHVSDDDLAPAPVVGKKSASKLELDFVLFPQYWNTNGFNR